MTRRLLCTLQNLALLLLVTVIAVAQKDSTVRIEPIPYIPTTEDKTLPDSLPIGSTNGMTASSGSYTNPTAPPEVARANTLGNIPVNLYTGAPVVNLPIYSLTEGRINLALSLSYAHSTIKPTAVAGWTGLGFELSGIPTLTRMIRNFPDEGYLVYDGSGGFAGQKGYYLYGGTITYTHNGQDKEPDYFFLSTPSGGGKFVFDRYQKAHFFPEADIKVVVSYDTRADGGGVVKRFTQFKFTFPDGLSYYFSAGVPEESAEIEVKDAQNGGIYPYPDNPDPQPFLNFIKERMIPTGWGCTKIESPYGEKIDFTYNRVAYTFYRLADNDATDICGNDVVKVNKVYVRSSLLSSIKTSGIELNFNTGYPTCTYDGSYNATSCTHSGIIPRQDIDSWGNAPTNSSYSGKLLKSITVKDLGSSSTTEELSYSFDYEYFSSTVETLPSGYSSADVGTTHKKRLKLKHINYPNGDKHTFNYNDENGSNLHSRFTYGVDHWGYRNSYSAGNSYGYIGSDELSNCGGNRTPYLSYADDHVLEHISHNTGTEVFFEYELNQAKNYPASVGGLRIKSLVSKDELHNKNIKKTYDYTLADNSSSGFLFIKPVYRINYYGANNSVHALSSLYNYLYAESGRPVVGYGRVTETSSTLYGGNLIGKTISYFDQDETEGSIKTNPSCTSGCQFNPIYFNLRQPDLRGGQMLKTEVYNRSNVLVQKTENTYTPSGGMVVNSTFCYQQHPKSVSTGSYYLEFMKYRPETQVSTTYTPGGSSVSAVSQTQYTYKDEMPAAYRNKYKGQHNMPVLTTSTDEEGRTVESRVLYTADFSFDNDTTVMCYPKDVCSWDTDCMADLCGYWQISTHVPLYGTEGRGIYEANRRNIFIPIETRQLINGQTVSANYTGLVSSNVPSIALPRVSYSLKDVPKSTFQEVSYQKNAYTLSKDFGYGTLPDNQILSYNIRGFAIDAKVNKGQTNRNAYIDNVIPQGSIAGYSEPDTLSQSRSIGKKYLGVDKEISSNLLERRIQYAPTTGRPLYDRNKDNKVIKRYNYQVVPTPLTSISWDESGYSKTCGSSGVLIQLKVNGITSPAVAQFSKDGGVTWQGGSYPGSLSYTFSIYPATGSTVFKARPSNNHSDVISVTKDISCSVAFGWGSTGVSTHSTGPPKVCKYDLQVVGLSAGGTAQFSIDNGSNWHTANTGNDSMQYALLAAPSTQQFWARDSNHPGNVITITLNVCN